MSTLRWLVRTVDDVPDGDDWLTAEEADVEAGYRVPKRRSDWRLGRYTAKAAVASVLVVSPDRVAVVAAPDGAPEAVLDGEPAPVSLSISHRERWGLAVVAPATIAVGGDLEVVEPRSEAFVREWFAEEEQRRVLASADRHREAALVWAAKEAAAKVLREGLRLDVRHAVVSFADEAHDPWQGWRRLAVDCRHEDRLIAGWWRVDDRLVTVVAADPPHGPPVPVVVG